MGPALLIQGRSALKEFASGRVRRARVRACEAACVALVPRWIMWSVIAVCGCRGPPPGGASRGLPTGGAVPRRSPVDADTLGRSG